MSTLANPATLEDFLRAEAEAPEGTRLALIDGEIVVPVNRPNGDAQIFTARQELTAEPELPGFRASIESMLPKLPS